MWVFALFGLTVAISLPDKARILTQKTDLDGVIALNTSEYDYFVVSTPRPYALIVLFTADLPKQKCRNCLEIAHSFRSVAYSYANSPFRPPISEENCENSVFFAKIDSKSDSLGLFEAHGFLSLPVLAVTRPFSVLCNATNCVIPKADVLELAFSAISTQKLLEFVNSRTGQSIKLIYSPYETAMELFRWLGMVVCVAFGLITLRKTIIEPKFMIFVSILVYFLCISGTIYILLHKPPLFGLKGSGKYLHSSVISTQARHQYIAEGYYTGFMALLGALCLVLLNCLDSVGSGYLLDSFSLRFRAYTAISAFLLAIYQLDCMYRAKASWYFPRFFWPPDHYLSGPLTGDQGNSF